MLVLVLMLMLVARDPTTMGLVINLNLRGEGNVVPSREALDCCPESRFSMRRQREGASKAAARHLCGIVLA